MMSDKLLLNYKGNLDVSVTYQSSYLLTYFRISQEPFLVLKLVQLVRFKAETTSMCMIYQEQFPKTMSV